MKKAEIIRYPLFYMPPVNHSAQLPLACFISPKSLRSLGAVICYSLILAILSPPGIAAEMKPGEASLELQALEDLHSAAETVARKPVTDADASYRSRLEKHQKTAQAAGNLKSLQAARQAIGDLDAGQPPSISRDPEVAGIQKPYIDQRQKAVAECETALANAERDHLASMKKLVVELTKAGHFDQAKAVQAKVDGLAVILSPATAVASGSELETWKRKALEEFPALKDPASPLSKRVQALREQKKSNPNHFKNPQWLYLLAKEAEQTSPPAGARFFNGKWYFVYGEKSTWTAARDNCIKRGGQLAVIPDASTQEFVKELAAGKLLWLGATDSVREGDWRWVDGTVMKFRNFSPGEPNNNGNGEHCLAINYRNTTGAWNDAFSNNRDGIPGYICEWPDLAPGPSPPSEAATAATKPGGSAITPGSQPIEARLSGKWDCVSASGWTGVYEFDVDGTLRIIAKNGDPAIGRWTQKGDSIIGMLGDKLNFTLHLPINEGYLTGISSRKNFLKVTRRPDTAAAKTETPDKPRGIVTGRANQLSQAQGGKSRVMADMEFILSKYGAAENDMAAHPDVTIYEGQSPGGAEGNCRITYLMPREKAEAQLFKNRGIVSRKTAVAPGFPPEMVIHTYDIRFGVYNRLYLMVDLADQVVTMQLKAENANVIPVGPEWVVMERDFSTFDYVNTETRGTPRLIIDTRVLRRKSCIVVNMVAIMIKETTTWYVPNPLIKQILFHLDEDKRKSGKK